MKPNKELQKKMNDWCHSVVNKWTQVVWLTIVCGLLSELRRFSNKNLVWTYIVGVYAGVRFFLFFDQIFFFVWIDRNSSSIYLMNMGIGFLT